ncbi:hypothetical protein K470DRAFT_210985, partial [Piedraia hortae CBS 480.64]
ITNYQELELIFYSCYSCERCLPPTLDALQEITFCTAKHRTRNLQERRPSCFVQRHKHNLDCRCLNGLDLSQHKADSRESYAKYFTLIEQIIRQYKIQAEDIYNMDEKVFMIGNAQKTKAVFTRSQFEKGHLVRAGQNGSREWVTVIGSICGDGTSLPPAVIFAAVSGVVQDSWTE